ncbi:MAG TPA: WGxxGxxG family protein [Pyrinomonadaceae bacterium]|jgi:MYXO-CTERM domain-containing protein
MNKKILGIVRIVRYSVIVLILVVMTAALIYAQPNTNGNAGGRVDRGNDNRTETRVVERDNDTDWGWLGLLGLLGLAGLIPKKRKVEVQEFRDTNQPTAGR